jgi:hypothetical protein
MQKFKRAVAAGVLAAIVLVGGVALAGSYGTPAKVTELSNFGSTGGKNYLVRGPTPGTGHGCANTDWTTVIPSASAEQRELMATTLLSAFLAGKTVQLETATTLGAGNCVGGRPVYTTVVVLNN